MGGDEAESEADSESRGEETAMARRLLRTERRARVMIVILDNPPRNFMDRRLVRELDDLMTDLARDASIGGVVITGGHPRSFVTHYDVSEILTAAEQTPDVAPVLFGGMLRAVGAIARIPGGPALLRRIGIGGMLTVWRYSQLYVRMNCMDKVFVAAINGFAAGAGCELALACDVRLIADGDFTIGLTEPVLGFNPGGGGGQRLARTVGAGRAVEILLEAPACTPAPGSRGRSRASCRRTGASLGGGVRHGGSTRSPLAARHRGGQARRLSRFLQPVAR